VGTYTEIVVIGAPSTIQG